jgi:alpha-glucoside transport system permease protein
MEDFEKTKRPKGFFPNLWLFLWRMLIAIVVPGLGFIVMYAGFRFLRDSNAPAAVIAVVAIIWGVGGVAMLFFLTNWVITQFGPTWRRRLQPFLFVGPALAILGWYLVLPTLRSLYLSFFGPASNKFVGLANYAYVFTDRVMLTAFRNNLLWLVLGTGLSVLLGLIIALMAERSHLEKFSKALIFLPLAISFIGAGVIWKFVYAYQPAGASQIGILNAIVTAFGGQPVGWLTARPWNTLFLIIILVWMQTGFAMIVLSAALRGVPTSLKEAARIDGARELRVITSIVIPYIRGTIVTVATTILIITLKIWDIVYSMTNGLYGTEVLASQQYKQMFKFLNYGRGSAIAIVLLIAVIPVMWYNLKQFMQREVF